MARFTVWRPTRTGIIFIVVTVLLAAAVFAGAWYVRERGEQVRQQEAAEIARQNLEEESETPVIAEETAPAEGEASNDGVAVEDSAASTAPGALPETGADTVTVLGVFALSLVSFLYLASRRTLNVSRH